MSKNQQLDFDTITFHWSAGRWNQIFFAYHYNIVYDPTTDIAKVIKTCASDKDIKSHTWRRNTRNLGIVLCCALDATPGNLGKYPPTAKQIEVACAFAGKKAFEANVPADRIKTHAEWAAIDGYGFGSGDPETRWDLWVPRWNAGKKNLSELMRDKTLWYKSRY